MKTLLSSTVSAIALVLVTANDLLASDIFVTIKDDFTLSWVGRHETEFDNMTITNRYRDTINAFVFISSEAKGQSFIIIDQDIPSGGRASGNLSPIGDLHFTYCSTPFEQRDCGGVTVPFGQMPFPVPTISDWSLIIMTLLAFTAGTILFGRRRRAANAPPALRVPHTLCGV